MPEICYPIQSMHELVSHAGGIIKYRLRQGHLRQGEGWTYAKLVGHANRYGDSRIGITVNNEIIPLDGHTSLTIYDIDFMLDKYVIEGVLSCPAKKFSYQEFLPSDESTKPSIPRTLPLCEVHAPKALMQEVEATIEAYLNGGLDNVLDAKPYLNHIALTTAMNNLTRACQEGNKAEAGKAYDLVYLWTLFNEIKHRRPAAYKILKSTEVESDLMGLIKTIEKSPPPEYLDDIIKVTKNPQWRQ